MTAHIRPSFSFMLPPFVPHGTAGLDVTTIDLSASPTQPDFDIDMTGFHELEVWFQDVDATGTGMPRGRCSTDGITYRSSAGDYSIARRDGVGANLDDDETFMEPWGPGAATTAVNVWAHQRFVGFNLAGSPVMHQGAYFHDAGASFRAGWAHGVTRFNNCTHIRLGELARFGTAGVIKYVKRTWADMVAHNALDWTSDTSGTIAGSIAVGAYDEVWSALSDQGGASGTRNTVRVSLDSTTFLSSSVYSSAIAYFNTGTTLADRFNASLDTTNRKWESPHRMIGLRDGGWASRRTGGRDLYDLMVGSVQQVDPVTHIAPHSWDDGVAFNAGGAAGCKIQHTAKDAEVRAIAGGSASIVYEVAGYKNAQIAFAHAFGASAAKDMLLEVSTDGGSTYLSAGYYYAASSASSVTRDAAIMSTITTATTNNACRFDLCGIESGANFVAEWIGNALATPRLGLGYVDNTDAVTHVRLTLADAATFNAMNVSLRKWR